MTEPLTDQEFAAEVARLGAQGKNQSEIGEALGLTKWQVRQRLLGSGYKLVAENRVLESKSGRYVKPREMVS